MPRMMTIRQVAKTGILPQNAIRRLVSENRMPCIKIGNRTMINYDLLVEHLDGLSKRNGGIDYGKAD